MYIVCYGCVPVTHMNGNIYAKLHSSNEVSVNFCVYVQVTMWSLLALSSRLLSSLLAQFPE